MKKLKVKSEKLKVGDRQYSENKPVFFDLSTFNFQLSTQEGFTLIELLIAVAVFVVISVGIVALVSNVFVSSSKQSNLLADSDQARKVGFNIMNELRNAQTSSTGAYALASAAAQDLMFYSNIDGGTDIERIRYFAQNGKFYKGVLKPTGNPLAYTSTNEKTFVVQDNLANGSTTLFYYYDTDYDGTATSSLAQPVSVTAVKFVKLDLKVYNRAGVLNTNFYNITASGAVRNLKENLGDPGQPDYFYQLTLAASPPAGGSTAVSPAGPDYPEGSLANLTAYPALGYAFSSWTGDVTNPGAASTTIVMDQSQTVTANFNAIAQSLTGSINSSKSGSDSARRWTLRVDNPNSYAVNSTRLYSFSLTQTAGTACNHSLTSPTLPALLSGSGNIAAGGNRTIQVTINFSGCSSSARFTADFTFAGNSGANWGSASIPNQQK